MPGKLVLVTGGARSGKSEFAERYVLHYGEKCAYIATAEILDAEMAERVRLHRARRPQTRWINFEAPYDAHEVMANVTNEVGAGIVPENAMAREYRDIAGWVNQQVAEEADSVFYCVAGQAVDMKKLAFKYCVAGQAVDMKKLAFKFEEEN